MRNLVTLSKLRGQIVHDVIAEALKSLRYGVTITPRVAKDNVTAIIRERYAESAKKLWHVDNRPPGRKQSEITSLVEHYYHFSDLNERAREAQQVAWRCVENLFGSDFWAEIVGAGPSGWVEIEEGDFPSFDLDGIKVYTKIDLARSNGGNTIIDWKTGSPNEADRNQLTLYSLYAASKWKWDPCETRLAAVYLQPELRVETFTPTADELEGTREMVRESFARMMEVEPAYGPADIARFPISENLAQCAWCRFQGICEGAKRQSATTTNSPSLG